MNRVPALIKENGIDRAIIDSTMLLKHFSDNPKDDVTTFATNLKKLDATVFLVSEMTDPSSYSKEHYLAHGVVFLHNYLDEGRMKRAIQVIKMRGTPVDTDMYRAGFEDGGFRVYPNEKVADSVGGQ